MPFIYLLTMLKSEIALFFYIKSPICWLGPYWQCFMEIDRLINQAVISRVAIAVKNYRAAAVRKSATRRRISRIILASVVNASNRRRRGLGIGRTYEQTEMTESPQEQTTVTPFWFCEQ